MSSLPTAPAQLAPFTCNPHFRTIIESAARRYADHVYLNSKEVIRSTASDGMARHSEFNRGLAEGFKRASMKAGWDWEMKHDASLPFEGDLVFLEKFKGQVRFGMQIGERKFSILHMTGNIDVQEQKLEVMRVGPARQNYIQGQSLSVVRNEPPNLFNQGEVAFSLRPHSEEPLHILIVTQRRGFADVRVWAALPVDHWEEDGVIPLAELEHLFDVPIDKAATRTVKREGNVIQLDFGDWREVA